MTTKEAVTVHKLDRNLLAPTILEAENEFVKPDFLKSCTVHIAISLDIQLGDSVGPGLNIEGGGGIFSGSIVVTEEHLAKGIDWHSSVNLIVSPGAVVNAYYTVKTNDGCKSRSPDGRYIVK